MTIHWNAVERYFTVVLSAIQFYQVCNLEKFENNNPYAVAAANKTTKALTGVNNVFYSSCLNR